MDWMDRLTTMVIENYQSLMGRPVVIDGPGIRNPDGTVSTARWHDATVAAISEGICPLCGSGLGPDLACRAQVHRPVQWDKSGMIMMLGR